jgi:hypothetical protein
MSGHFTGLNSRSGPVAEQETLNIARFKADRRREKKSFYIFGHQEKGTKLLFCGHFGSYL